MPKMAKNVEQKLPILATEHSSNRQTHRHTKSHVKHAVSFIKHEVGHPLQVGCFHFDQVNQSPLLLPIHTMLTSHTISHPPPLDYGTNTHITFSPHPPPPTHKQCHTLFLLTMGTDTHTRYVLSSFLYTNCNASCCHASYRELTGVATRISHPSLTAFDCSHLLPPPYTQHTVRL